jgi:hypothetical protein
MEWMNKFLTIALAAIGLAWEAAAKGNSTGLWPEVRTGFRGRWN